ncbi:MAG TPA: MgtC/SapB family protein [Syntrophales bacterium]|nr:MgtC/SapB family protein [Syntrophobacterales bacterium]HQL89422.1 MgtC/SapB family protein [Syntrophales bacterium]
MSKETTDIFIHLVVAMVAGGLIGLERSYYGRPAGFRTHTLVCMASSLLMLVTIYQRDWFTEAMIETVRVDPTRMAQGIMTGIGFLGAGVIMKEGASIRGLTTAASIWITAAIGIPAGVGFYSALVAVTVLTLSTLTLYRFEEIKALMKENGFKVSNLCCAVTGDRKFFDYDLIINTRNQQNLNRLCRCLEKNEAPVEFKPCPTSD